MEGLELAYSAGMLLWDNFPKPMCIMHLYNMATRLGYIKSEIGLYRTLSSLFGENFFPDGKSPKKEFVSAFTSVSTLIIHSVKHFFDSHTLRHCSRLLISECRSAPRPNPAEQHSNERPSNETFSEP